MRRPLAAIAAAATLAVIGAATPASAGDRLIFSSEGFQIHVVTPGHRGGPPPRPVEDRHYGPKGYPVDDRRHYGPPRYDDRYHGPPRWHRDRRKDRREARLERRIEGRYLGVHPREIWSNLRSRGFHYIEIERDGRYWEVEAERGGREFEFEVSRRSGRIRDVDIDD